MVVVRKKSGRAYIGTSGWNYPHWGNGVFYPAKLPAAQWLKFYARVFDTVEINNTFYQLPPPNTFSKWFKETPSGFVFALKVNRYLTHIKKLKDPEQSTKKLFNHLSYLKDKVGPLLFQFPPSWRVNLERLTDFFHYLKRQTILPEVRAVFEFRHPSWFTPEVLQQINAAGYSLCYADWPIVQLPGTEAQADYVYFRRHGAGQLYGGCYSESALKNDAELCHKFMSAGKDVYIYFNNDANGWAVKNALTLKQLIHNLK